MPHPKKRGPGRRWITTRTALQARETLRWSSSEVVGDAEVDLFAFDRARQQHAARAGRNAGNARVAFGQADLVRDVGALHAELPVRAVVGDDAEVPGLVHAERGQAGLVFVTLADMRVGEPRHDVAP